MPSRVDRPVVMELKNTARTLLLEVAKGYTLQCIPNSQSVTSGDLVADGFLQSGSEIVEQKAEEYQHHLQKHALPNPGGIKRRSLLLRLDQQSHRIRWA